MKAKRILPLLLAALLMLLLCGCGGGAEQGAAEEAQQTLRAELDTIRDSVHPGTAGSALRAVNAAARLLDWAAGSSLTEEQAAQTVRDWAAVQSDETKAHWPEQVDSVTFMLGLLTEGGEEAEGLLTDAGCADTAYPWSAEAAALARAALG